WVLGRSVDFHPVARLQDNTFFKASLSQKCVVSFIDIFESEFFKHMNRCVAVGNTRIDNMNWRDFWCGFGCSRHFVLFLSHFCNSSSVALLASSILSSLIRFWIRLSLIRE